MAKQIRYTVIFMSASGIHQTRESFATRRAAEIALAETLANGWRAWIEEV